MTNGTMGTPARVGMRRAPPRLRGTWDAAGVLAALVAAAALWVLVLAGVAAPLGDALARIDAAAARNAAPQACPVPAGALASAARAHAARCR